MKLRHWAAALTLMVTTTTSTNAALTVYTDRAAFQAALNGGFATETFNSVAGEPDFRTTPLTVGSLTLQGFGTGQFDRNYIDQPPAQFSLASVNGTAFINAAVADNSGLRISFATGMIGFGADFADFQSIDGDTGSTIQIGSELFTPSVLAGVRFLGFISTTEFSTVTFPTRLQGDGFGIDNVTFASRS